MIWSLATVKVMDVSGTKFLAVSSSYFIIEGASEQGADDRNLVDKLLPCFEPNPEVMMGNRAFGAFVILGSLFLGAPCVWV